MTVKELKELLNKFENESEISVIGWNEYNCEIEGLKIRDAEPSNYGNKVYLNISVNENYLE